MMRNAIFTYISLRRTSGVRLEARFGADSLQPLVRRFSKYLPIVQIAVWIMSRNAESPHCSYILFQSSRFKPVAMLPSNILGNLLAGHDEEFRHFIYIAEAHKAVIKIVIAHRLML